MKQAGLLAAIVAVSVILRAPITGVGSLLGMIREGLGLGSGMAGFLTTIPLLAFAVVSLLVGGLGSRFGAGRVMLGGLAILTIGILVRSYAGMPGLLVGTVLVGVGIAIGNVLLPAVIKSRFPNKVGGMTSMYTTVMSACAGISGGISVSLAKAFGWRQALVIWVVLTATAFAAWLPHRKLNLTERQTEDGPSADRVTRAPHFVIKSGMAWWIALYMGLQSFMFYCFVAWLATILHSRGYSAQVAGYFNAAYMLLGIPGSLIVPILAGRSRSQSKVGAWLGIIYIIGLASMLWTRSLPALLIAMLCCGFCSGACISFSMALFGLHTTNAADASALSGFSQSLGYLLAAAGPTVMGKLYDYSGGWTMPLVMLLALALILTLLGYLVGREKMVQ